MENKMKFKVGQKVWCSRFGWGVIYLITPTSDYPVNYKADANAEHLSYTNDGREFIADILPTLFHKEQKLDLTEPAIANGTLGYFWDKDATIATFARYGGMTDSGTHKILNGYYDWDNFCPHPELPPNAIK
jgi:hypothetical protein